MVEPTTAMLMAGLGQGLGGGIGSLFGLLGDDGDAERAAMLREWRGIPLPNYDYSYVPAPVLTSTGRATPETFTPTIRGGPREIAPSSARDDLENALRYFTSVRKEGLPLEEKIAAGNAQRAIAAERRRGQDAVDDALRRRGRGSGGAAAVLSALNNQGNSEFARSMAADLALAAINNRFNAAGAEASTAGALAGYDTARDRSNQDAWNRYNEWTTRLMTDVENANRDERVRAQMYNLDNAQRIADANAANRYSADNLNIDRRNMLEGNQFQNRATIAAGATGALGQQANAADAGSLARRDQLRDLGMGVGGLAGGLYGISQTTPSTPKPTPAKTPSFGSAGFGPTDEYDYRRIRGY